MTQKSTGVLFERGRFPGGTTTKAYTAKSRETLMKRLGAATKVHVHVRVYDRSPAGAPVIDFEADAGCFSNEAPGQGFRQFTITPGGVLPVALPWSAAGGFTPPDDGYFSLVPTMGFLEIVLKVSGTAATWVELEAWYTVEFSG